MELNTLRTLNDLCYLLHIRRGSADLAFSVNEAFRSCLHESRLRSGIDKEAATTTTLIEKFGTEREEITEGSRETIGNVIAQLNAIEERLEKSSVLVDSTEEI
jgi:hypothetical protein